jgi:hypothetical protein
MSKNGRTRAYYCQRRNSRGSHACTNGKGIPEQALDAAVIESLYKLVEDPEVAWALVTERSERWARERAVTSDERANLEAEEKRLETAIGRLLDHLEAGEDVGLRLKQRRAELDALRVRLAEPEGLTVEQEDFEKALAANVEWLKWRGPVVKPSDATQTRAAMRALGIGKVTVTPTESGWTFAGDGNLSGMVGALRGACGFRNLPPGFGCAGKAGARTVERTGRSNRG